MSNELNASQVVVLEVLTQNEQYAAAYRYVAEALGDNHAATSWFEAASAINAHANGLGTPVRGGYAQGANFATDLVLDTDLNPNTVFDIDNAAASNAIAVQVLGSGPIDLGLAA